MANLTRDVLNAEEVSCWPFCLIGRLPLRWQSRGSSKSLRWRKFPLFVLGLEIPCLHVLCRSENVASQRLPPTAGILTSSTAHWFLRISRLLGHSNILICANIETALTSLSESFLLCTDILTQPQPKPLPRASLNISNEQFDIFTAYDSVSPTTNGI